MSLTKLANLFELKYKKAQPNFLNDIRNNIINAYNLYVNSDKAKDPALQILANSNEPFSKEFISIFEELIANIDGLTAHQIFNRLNKMLALINAVKSDPGNKVRNFIHQIIPLKNKSDLNYRELFKSKFENILQRLSSIFEKQNKVLGKILSFEFKETEFNRVRKELSDDKILLFMKSPAAKMYGLDSFEVMEKILFYPELKNKLTTLINAVDRGHVPLNGIEIRMIAKEINDALQSKHNNSALFDGE